MIPTLHYSILTVFLFNCDTTWYCTPTSPQPHWGAPLLYLYSNRRFLNLCTGSQIWVSTKWCDWRVVVLVGWTPLCVFRPRPGLVSRLAFRCRLFLFLFRVVSVRRVWSLGRCAWFRLLLICWISGKWFGSIDVRLFGLCLLRFSCWRLVHLSSHQ